MHEYTTDYLRSLGENLVRSFSKSELATLCFDLGVNNEDIPGEDLSIRAKEIIDFFVRRDQLPDLINRCQELRPSINWQGKVVNIKTERRSYCVCGHDVPQNMRQCPYCGAYVHYQYCHHCGTQLK